MSAFRGYVKSIVWAPGWVPCITFDWFEMETFGPALLSSAEHGRCSREAALSAVTPIGTGGGDNGCAGSERRGALVATAGRDPHISERKP